MHSTPRFSPARRQRGNTITGVIIGLIIGLGIAVAVALAITKGATPFTDKSGKVGKMAEPTAGQAADPNKPLYSNKEAAREANRQIADKPKAAADPLAQVIANMKDPADVKAEVKAPAVVVAAAQVPASHELARVVNARADVAADDKIIYFLQAGAFREMTDAESTRAKLALLGYEATISDRASDAGVLHRVRIGPFGQVESMNKARAKLIDSGIDVAIVRNQR
ncbi:cell division protein [Massilia eurypsychrophila]|jgi:cell division protein FtsN|uniref:Cell division protein n=1 Tax=Massilia eurypsychrophila TaxID=1485217 RepID=A0A2G8THG7_9BURK|nr:SPOR domain-containing protein [Massilia eurypsychrophila]PIL45475.1 cell division protein [Massilia eurypsychrophila]